MTPDELRSLVQEATPGQPWKPTLSKATVIDLLRRKADIIFEDADRRLISLAPQLALLVAEMGEALRYALDTADDYSGAIYKARDALASLEALEKP